MAAKAERHKSPQIVQRGRAIRAGGGGAARLAYCKADAPDSPEIECYLDTDETGTLVTVRCLIHNGDSLMYATPYLKNGDPLLVEKVGDEWICPGFNGAKFTS